MQKMKLLTTPLIWWWMAVAGMMHGTSSVNTTNSVQPFGTNSGKGMGGGDKSVLGINISETKVYGDKPHLSTMRPSAKMSSLAAAADSGDTRQSLLPVLEDNGDNIHNDVLDEINKSNQEHTKSHHQLTSAALGGKAADSALSSSYFERVEWQEARAPAGSKDKLLLHRHKRYLLFPEGSSFQLVFDLIIPIVDYTNFAIMGITCAVAWELPSKAPSEIIDNFRHKLNDGTLGFSRRNDSVQQRIQYISDQDAVATQGAEWGSNSRQPHNQLSPATATASAAALQQTPPKNAYYANMWQQPQTTNKATTPKTATPTPTHLHYQQPGETSYPETTEFSAGTKSWSMTPNSNRLETQPSASWQAGKWWEHNKDRVENQWQWQSLPPNQRIPRNRKILSKRPKHRIYPVFGKRKRRSIHNPDDHHNDELTKKLNEIHMKQHLDSRHTLYAKIEKLYKTRGHNGTACVLRTLCETHKLQRKRRHHNHQPDTFVMELLRVIFSLPPNALATKSLDSPYTAAMLQAPKIQSCSHQYDGCELPIWRNVQI